MLDQVFGRISSSQWIVFLALVILLVGLSQLAWRLGCARSRKKPEEEKDSGTVRSAVLALLGLLLGFSFAIAGARYEARRELLVEEANSIGTTVRRAELLPQPMLPTLCVFLREYVPLRIEAHREAQFSDQFATLRKRTAELQDRLWAEAVAAATERPTPITASFISSLNETMDLEGKRIAAKRNHVPGAVWLLLLCVSGCGFVAGQLPGGTSGRHSILERFVFPVLVAIVITLITESILRGAALSR